ncbi:MAG: GAF domain-containing protein [Symploca sp. SIO2B6]|nr:GAF domain-containing protein [Symploca sp. SIO2B6]
MEPSELRQQLGNLNSAGHALMKCQSVEDAVQQSLREVRQKLNVQVASVFLFSNEGVIQRVGTSGVDGNGTPLGVEWLPNEKYEPGESFSGKAVPLTGQELGFGEPHFSNDILEDYPEMRYASKYNSMLGGLRCGISVPLNGLNRTFGTLEVLNSQYKSGFTSDDVYWLMLIGMSLSNCISTFRRREKQKLVNHIIGEFISLAATNRDFNSVKIYQFIADSLVGTLPEFPCFTPFKACIIRLSNDDEDLEIKAKSYADDISWEGREDGSVRAGSQIVGQVYHTNEPQFIVDTDSEIERFNNKKWITKNNLKSFACLPLSRDGKCVGTISVYAKFKYLFFESNKYFLNSISFLTTAVIARVHFFNELARVRRELRAEQQKVLNASFLVGYDSLLTGILHQYKNELIDFHHTLENLSSNSSKSQRDKEYLIEKKLSWIKKRVDEVRTGFSQDHPVPIDLNTLIQDAVRVIVGEQEICLCERYDDGVPIIALDENKIRTVICNLLANALVAIGKSDKRTGKISVSTNVLTVSRIQYIQVVIEDNGVGIPNENRERIFEQGFTTRKREGGTGVGLYVTRGIIEDYGGKVDFVSKVGKGTKFFIQIPLKRYLI